MQSIFGGGHIFQIIQAWIILATISVIDLLSFWRSNKRAGDKQMDEPCFPVGVLAEGYTYVTGRLYGMHGEMHSMLRFLVRSKRPHFAVTRNFIQSFVTDNRTPLFGVAFVDRRQWFMLRHRQFSLFTKVNSLRALARLEPYGRPYLIIPFLLNIFITEQAFSLNGLVFQGEN